MTILYMKVENSLTVDHIKDVTINLLGEEPLGYYSMHDFVKSWLICWLWIQVFG